jgi:uncharacterized protein
MSQKTKPAPFRRKPIPLPVLASLDAVYASLPIIVCQRKCQAFCGPVFMSGAEWQRIQNRLGREPEPRQDLACPMLGSAGDCKVHDIRPGICRLWGITKTMVCPHGCEPTRWLSDEECSQILKQLAEIGGGV